MQQSNIHPSLARLGRVARRKHQQGMIFVTSLIMLLVMTMLGITLVNGTTMDERMAANRQEESRTLQIADSGIQKMLNDGDVFVYGVAVPRTVHPYHDGTAPTGEAKRFLLTYEKSAGSEHAIGSSGNPRMIWEAGEYSRYYFDLAAESQSPAGISSRVRAGALAVGKASAGG